MLRLINGFNSVYCIKTYSGVRHYVETNSESELAIWCAEKDVEGWLITSVTKLDNDGSTPRVPIKSMPEYKKKIKQMMQ